MEQHQSSAPDLESRTHIEGEDVYGVPAEGIAMSARITQFLRACWLRKKLFFGVIGAGIVLSLLYAFLEPNIYTSTTTLMPPENASSSSGLLGLLSATGAAAAVGGSGALGIKTPGAQFVGILESRTVQEDLVKQFDLMRIYKTRLMEDACKKLTADSAIHEDAKSGIITISVQAKNPELAAKIAQGYVDDLDRVVTANSTSSARRERMFLEGRLKDIKRDLDDSSKVLSQFSTKNKTIDIASQGKAMVDSGIRLQDQMAAARSDLAALQQTYSEDNLRVKAAHARIAELQSQMNKMMGSQEQAGASPDNSSYPTLTELPTLGLTYADLARKVAVQEALWEALTKQYEAARVQEAKEIPSVRVLDAANIPQHKSAPVRASILMLGTMLSFFVACLLVFAISFWEGMDAQDEPRKLLLEIFGSTFKSLRRS